MKKIIALLFFLVYITGFAQLDTDHWFAPVAARSGVENYEGYLYLSTNETTPFQVQISTNNAVVSTVTISKNNPAQVVIPQTYMLALPQAQLFTPIAKGLFVKGPKKFYANYRWAITSHAEIITSKGLAGLGTTFYAAMAPNSAANTYINSTIGVIATEDNTTVTFSGYNSGVIFSDGIQAPTRTITLNRGQAYVMDVVSNQATANLDGLIGTKIVATKPISVTNGNYNAIYTQQNFTNNDILMDQSVPVDRLGKDFVVVKGNGPVTSGMEAVLVVATENGTQLQVNGANYGTPMNVGQYTVIQGTSYINQGNGHYNMSVKSNKNMYVYQLLSGTSTGNVYPAGGFNYIPPLSCFLPNKVDEVGFINKIGATSYETKLNIITQTGAAVTVNGAPIAAVNGPYPVSGNPNWVSYSVPNVSGNITVNSTKSVTAGIAAGSGAVGYGGYFAGFSSVPAIAKTGDCYAGILLQVDNSYDAYQWYLNGTPIPGATGFSINPELYGAGAYTVLITKTDCESKLTDPYNYTLCPPITTSTHTIGSCKTLTINPAFTNPQQPINPSQTAIIGAPTYGTATVNPTTGQITYTPSPTITADTTDQFIYYIQGTGNPFTFEYFKVIVNIDVLQTTNGALSGCSGTNGNGLFDLTSVSVTPDSNTTINYYSNAALTVPITAPSSYSSPSGTVYANITSQYGCSKTAQITLTVNSTPNLNTANYNGTLCDDNLDGIVQVDFSTVTPQIVSNSTNFNVRYYLNQADATAGNASTLPNIWNVSGPTTVYVRVDALTGGCQPAFGQINFQLGTKITLSSTDVSTQLCDNNLDGTENVDLNSFKTLFTTDPAVTLTFHGSLADAQNNTAPIPANQVISATNGVFYIRFQSPSGCPNVAKLTVTLKVPQQSTTLTNQTICANTTATLNAGPGFTAYLWSTGATTASINVGPGNYYVDLTSANGCVYRQNVTVTGVTPPNLSTTSYNSALCDDNFDGTVTVNFATVTPQIVSGAAGFNVRYYATAADAAAGNGNTLPAVYSYTAPVTVYVRVDALSGNCAPALGQINFTIGNKIPLLTAHASAEVCDSNINGSEQVNLNDFDGLFTADPGVSLSFYSSLAQAQAGTGALNAIQTVTGSGTFYIRFTSASQCPNTAQLTITVKAPKASTTLADVTICPTQTTVLDAGPGFTSYLWSTGAATQTITVGVGNYYVDLGSNGCVYRQHVKVLPAAQPVITSVTVNGQTATINATGGTPPYQYSLDGVNFQSSNVFTGLKKGIHRAYVLSAENCEPGIKDFTVIGLYNIITPNADGINDIIDFSELSLKEKVSIQIYDRYGALIHQPKAGTYSWDGKLAGRPLNTDSYWYKISYVEPDTKETVTYTGWILLKNKE